MALYGKAEYWDERYTKDPEPFDWYQRWAGLKDTMMGVLQPSHRILNLGCGNSRLSEEMYEDGFHDITNIDISTIVIKNMQEKYQDKPGLSFMQLNALDMKEKFSDGLYDCVIDKGTMDSILCGEGSTHNIQTMLREVSRVLKPNGIYIVISYGQPSYRMSYLQRADYGWSGSVSVQAVQKPLMGLTGSTMTGDEKENCHYIYICTKQSGAGAALLQQADEHQ
mmetsp:Transcript_55385/g.108420  ORF Transcript_55385/g.108420 Transcript_55385/m.108420 type:complete len:223 (+) Transcript_55385:253-921(+)